MKAAILSAGAWSAAAHVPALNSVDGVELTAVSSPNASTARRFADEFGFAHRFTDYRSALELKPDVVIVNSPPAFHRDMVIAALESGADVLCEKPFAPSLADAAAMSEVARRNGRNLMSGFGWVHMPMFAEAARLIGEGELGDVEHVSVGLTVNVRELLVSGTPYTAALEAFAPEAATYTDPAVSGGGAAAVSATHAFAVLLSLASGHPTGVFARMARASNGLDLHDVVAVDFAGGGIGVVTCTSVHAANNPVDWRVEVTGSGGSLWIDSSTGDWRHSRSDGTSARTSVGEGFSVYDSGAPTRSLVTTRSTGEPYPYNNVDVAERTTAIMEGAYLSAETGERQPLGQ